MFESIDNNSEIFEIPAGKWGLMERVLEVACTLEPQDLLGSWYLQKCDVPQSLQRALLRCEDTRVGLDVGPLLAASRRLIEDLRSTERLKFLKWLAKQDFQGRGFTPYPPHSRRPGGLKQWEKEAIDLEEGIIQDIMVNYPFVSSKHPLKRGDLYWALRMLKAVTTWLWQQLAGTPEWQAAVGEPLPSRAGVLLNFLTYGEAACSRCPALWRALNNMKNLPYLLPLGLRVSTDTYSTDDIMSVEELSFYLRLDYEREPTKQRLLLPFDPAKQEKIREALKSAADSLSNDLIRFGIEDLKILRKAGPLTGQLAHFEPVFTESNWAAQKVAFLKSCRTFAGGLAGESQVPALVHGFDSQLPVYLITACDDICRLAHREKIDVLDDDSEGTAELQYLIQLEEGARANVLLAKERVSTRDYLGSVDLLVLASLIIMEAPQEDINAALEQWPYVNPSPWRVESPIPDLWNNLLRRLKKSGWDNRR